MMNILAAFASPARWLLDYVQGWDTEHTSKKITAERALEYAPIWYGVNKIAGHIAQLPINVYRRLDRGSEKDKRHSVYRLMRKPNAYQTSVVFREQIAKDSLLEGNGRAAIVRVGGRVAELIPLHPTCTSTGMLMGEKLHATRPHSDDRLRLFFDSVDGSDDGVIMLQDAEVMHIPGLTYDGVRGIPLREIAKNNLRASLNGDARLAEQMENGFSGSLMLQAPAGVFRREEDAQRFLDEFEKRHNGAKNSGRVGMLREGITANVVAMNNRDAEMIENRRFQRQDAALWLGLEQILGDDSSVSYNSLEQKNLAYLMNCLNKWLKRWEEEIEFKLLPSRQYVNESHYVRFNTAALLKSDYKTSVESLALAIGATIISPNEARDKLDMNPYEGGDTFRNPAITPGESMQEDADDSDTIETDEEVASNALAIQAHLSHLIGVEANRVKAGSKRANNFLEWIDNFYGKKWEPQLADKFEAIGLDRDLASKHCDESRRRLIDVADYSSPETLAENVSKCVANWKSRAQSIGVVQHV